MKQNDWNENEMAWCRGQQGEARSIGNSRALAELGHALRAACEGVAEDYDSLPCTFK